jgi:hypothetical protein
MTYSFPGDEAVTPVLAQIYGIELTGPQRDRLRETRPDGVFLQRRNVETPEQVRDLAAALREAVGERLDVAVAHEGGAVTPFVRGVTPFPGPEALEAAGDAALARDVGRAMGAELSAMGISLNLVRDGGPMTDELRLGLRCAGVRSGPGPVTPASAPAPENGHAAALAEAVAAAAVRVVRDPRGLLPIAAARRVGLLVPRLGDVADRLPIEDGLRGTASVVRPRVGAGAAVLEIGVQPDDASAALAAEWMATQELAVFFCFQARRFAGQRRLLDALAARCPRRIVVAIGDSGDEALAGEDATVVRSCGFQACQLASALRAIFVPPSASGKRR